MSARQTGALMLALFAGFFAPVDHLSAAETRTADSAPKLLSTVGSKSETWSDVRELEAAAAKGNPRAEAALGELLQRGDGLPRDDARALALLEKSARAGHSPAAFRLGFLLSRGENGAARDPARAIAYFRAGSRAAPFSPRESRTPRRKAAGLWPARADFSKRARARASSRGRA
ncbi:MAG: tetratricopeptide repeat protein, partial [Opitutaceae bacterium]